MASRCVLTLLALVLLLTTPLLSAQESDRVEADTGIFAGDERIDQAQPGQLLSLQSVVRLPANNSSSWRAYLNATVDGTPLNGSYAQVNGTGDTMVLLSQFNVPEEPQDEVAVDYEVTVQYLVTRNASGQGGNRTGGNDTVENDTVQNETGFEQNATWETAAGFPEQDTLTLAVVPPRAPPAGPPWGLITAGAAVLLVSGAAVALYVRRPRQYQHEGGRRSQTLRELEGAGKRGGGGGGAGGAAMAEQEPKVHPQVKILEARKADVRRMIELAKERHERGALTEHQFNMIRRKKEAELQEIEEEIERYRSGEGRE